MTSGATNSGHTPPSLLEAGLQPVWARTRRHLDKHGMHRRGAIALPDLDPASELTLRSLLGRVNKRLDLARLETALVERGIGADLSEALTRLGHPLSAEAAQRRSGRARASAAQAVLRDAAESWQEPWAREWADAAIKAGLHSGLDPSEVATLVEDVRRLIDHLDRCDSIAAAAGPRPRPGPGPRGSLDRAELAMQHEPRPASRTELAASLFGSSHALDQGTRLASFVTRALRCRLGEPLGGRELWEASGIQPDRVSAPALAWAIPVTGNSPVDRAIRAATDGGLPLHVSLLAMLQHPLQVPDGSPVLVVENPRLVEAAAERGLGCCTVSTNGNPTTAVTTLVQQLQESGARLWYHGDFDAAGIAICRRMHGLACRPWRMDARDYQEAVTRAERDGVRLDRDSKACGPTPWDPALEELFDARRLIVHEEYVLDAVLDEFCSAWSPIDSEAGSN